MTTLIGRVIANRYELIEKLGGGGMAIVYKGKDRLLSRAVTVKILREQLAGDTEVVRRFQQEAQAVAKLSHPNIVSIYDVGQEQDLYYLVMEFIDGRTLKEVIQEKGRLEPKEAIGYARQLCDALQHAHDSNIIHRDIKPQNILITRRGQAKVTDFGIAKAATNATMTYSGSSIIGTVQYISPEQARGDMATVHTDIYSAGIVLYEMLTGRLPFEGDTAIGIAIKHIQADYPKPSNLVPDIPDQLEQVIIKALAKRPQDRFNSANEMKKALEQAVDMSAVSMGRTQVLPRITDNDSGIEERKPEKPRPRKKKPKTLNWVLLGAALLILVTGGLYYGFQRFLAVSEVQVPDVTNLSLAEAERNLLAEGLKWEIGSRRHHEEIPKDHVLDQKPGPGEKIKQTRAVVLDVSLGPNLAKVPDVIGFSLREARVEVKNAGFEVAQEVREEYSDDMAEGYILRQDPDPYDEAPVGSEVSLIVSLGPQPRYIDMPDLLGKTLPEATEILEEHYLELGEEVTYEVSYDYFAGQVVSQDILPGEQVLQKSAVNLSVSLGPGPASKRATVQVWVQDDGEKHQIRVVIIDQTGEHEEYNAVHDPNDFISIEVPYYGKGQAMVYEDDVLIKETTLQ